MRTCNNCVHGAVDPENPLRRYCSAGEDTENLLRIASEQGMTLDAARKFLGTPSRGCPNCQLWDLPEVTRCSRYQLANRELEEIESWQSNGKLA